MTTKTHVAITALALFLGLGAGGISAQTVAGNPDTEYNESPWTAHVDIARLRNSPLAELLVDTLSVDRVLSIKTALRQSLELDPATIRSATLLSFGGKLQDTAVILRGSFEAINLGALPPANGADAGDSVRLFERSKTNEPPLFLARHSPGELVAGTSRKAVEGSLASLVAKRKCWDETGLTDHARTEISASTASLSLDMRRIGAELGFEADLSRSMQRAWLMAGTRGQDVALTLLIESKDAEGIQYLRDQLKLLTMMALSQEGAPPEWAQLVQALRIESDGRWMTVKVSAPPAQATGFLQSLTAFFKEEAKPAPPPAKPGPPEPQH